MHFSRNLACFQYDFVCYKQRQNYPVGLLAIKDAPAASRWTKSDRCQNLVPQMAARQILVANYVSLQTNLRAQNFRWISSLLPNMLSYCEHNMRRLDNIWEYFVHSHFYCPQVSTNTLVLSQWRDIFTSFLQCVKHRIILSLKNGEWLAWAGGH